MDTSLYYDLITIFCYTLLLVIIFWLFVSIITNYFLASKDLEYPFLIPEYRLYNCSPEEIIDLAKRFGFEECDKGLAIDSLIKSNKPYKDYPNLPSGYGMNQEEILHFIFQKEFGRLLEEQEKIFITLYLMTLPTGYDAFVQIIKKYTQMNHYARMYN